MPLLAALVMAPLHAAAVSAADPPARPAVRPLSAEELARAYVVAWNEHDAEKAASFFDERVAYYDASTPERQVGRAAAKKNVVEAFMKMAPDCVWTITSAPISGRGGVTFEWEFSGTNSGDMADGTKATGKKFSFKGATVLRIRNYKILYQADYYDAYTFLKQLGLAK